MNHYLKTLVMALKEELASVNTNSNEIMGAAALIDQELLKENLELKLRIAALEKENTQLSLVGSTHLSYLKASREKSLRKEAYHRASLSLQSI